MPDKEFLESYQLYRKLKIDLPDDITEIPLPSINLFCKNCESVQTFTMADRRDMFGKIINDHPKGIPASVTDPNTIYARNMAYSSSGAILNVTYNCVGCGEFTYHYSIKIGDDLDYIMKIGQFPPLDISVDKNLKKMLGEHEDTYKKGLICESQGYGIGAYAYYRRIVEKVIDGLLEGINDLISDENKEEYKEALEQVQKSHSAQDKINIVKDLLPPVLMPAGNNPLKLLYSQLSSGIHSLSDDECLERASNIRNILLFLVKETINHQNSSKEFNESMKELLAKK